MMGAKHVFDIGTGKLHIKNPSEKWGGLGGKSLRTIYVVVFVLCFRLLTLIEFSAAFDC